MSFYSVAPFIEEFYPQYYGYSTYPKAECVTIHKVNGEWGIFCNFAATPIVVDGVEFKSSEQLFQMMKFKDAKENSASYDDVKHIIDDYADKGLIDTNRIYVTGSSDGGRGAWDYAQMHPDVFAAAISMSCSSPRPVSIPVYFFSTASEGDCTARVDELVKQGVDIKYKYCPDQKHGGDAIECTPELLKEFFAHTK